MDVLSVTSLSGWKYGCALVLSVTCRRTIQCGDLKPSCNGQLWEDLFSNTSQWWDNRLDKRSSRHPDFRHKRTRQPLWLNSQDKPVWVDFRLATLDAQLRSGLDRIQHLCVKGLLDEALDVLLHMDQEGVIPSVDMYRSLLRECSKRKALGQAKRVHFHLAQHGLESTTSLGEYVVSTLVRCGALEDALQVFKRLPYRTEFSWTAIISGYTMSGEGEEALRMYRLMQEGGMQPNTFTLASLLKACALTSDLEEGKRIHAEASKYGCQSDLVVGTSLVDMYSKCGSVKDAQNVFHGLTQRDIVSWNAMIAAYVLQGQAEKALQLHEQMLEEGVSPNNRTFVSVLQGIGMLAENVERGLDGGFMKAGLLASGKAIHADAQRRGYTSDAFLDSALISLYGKCGSIEDAQHVFNRLCERDVVSWNAMLAAYAQQADGEKALQLYAEMQEEGVSADVRTFVTALQACSILAEVLEEGIAVCGLWTKEKYLEIGKLLHANVWRKGYKSNIFIGNTLVSMYGKCGNVVDAQYVFDGLVQQSVVSWNAMLTMYMHQGQAENALKLYEQMQQEDVSADSRTFLCTLQACGMLAQDEEDVSVDGQWIKLQSIIAGKAIHAEACSKGHDSDVFIGSTAISMYGKCGSLTDAETVFDGLSRRTVVSWNVMLSAYLEQGLAEKALQLYREMQQDRVSPTDITFVCILQACSSTGNLDMCREMHQHLVSTCTNWTPQLASALIHAYGRCSSMVDAQRVFDGLPHPDIASWNTLLASYARQGDCTATLECYQEMQAAGMVPDRITFLSLLSGCSHAGLVDTGMDYFQSMSRTYGITPDLAHYACMVDLLGRAGCFTKLEALLSSMPMQPDLSLWLCLLGACQKHSQVVLGRHAFNQAVQLQPRHGASYLLMANIYSSSGLWHSSIQVHKLRHAAAARKPPGHSWIQHQLDTHSFTAGDLKQDHPQQEQLNDLLAKVS